MKEEVIHIPKYIQGQPDLVSVTVEALLGLRGDEVECVDGLRFTDRWDHHQNFQQGKTEEGLFRARY